MNEGMIDLGLGLGERETDMAALLDLVLDLPRTGSSAMGGGDRLRGDKDMQLFRSLAEATVDLSLW